MRLVPWVFFVLACVVAPPAFADGPMTRRDPQRLGEVVDPAQLRAPVVTWRRYLGGELTTDQMVDADVDADGVAEVVLIAGGKLVAKRADDTVVWETEPLALHAILHTADLDGDGANELIASGDAAFLGIFELRTGRLVWRLAPGTFGTVIGAVRLADLDGDGKLDLYAADQGCGSVNGKPRAIAWRFAGGFGPVVDDGSRRLFELPTNREYYCGYADVVADLDADGQVEIVAFGIRRAYVYAGATGQPLTSGAMDPGYDLGFSIPYGVMRTELARLPDGKRAIVAASNNSYDPSINSRALWVMTWNAAAAQADRLQLAWRRSVADVMNDRHSFGARLSADLDADGTVEVFSTFVESGRSTIEIFDVLTGTVKARRSDASFAGLVTLAAGERPTLLVSSSAGLEGLRFSSFSSGGFPAPAFTLPSGALLQQADRAARRVGNLGASWATVALAGQRRGLVLVRDQTIEAWSTEGTPAVVSALPLPPGVVVRGVLAHSGVAGAAEGLLVARSDGYLVVLDSQLTPINFATGEFGLPGIRTGGAYSGARGLGPVPLALRFDGGADELLARDSLGRLLRLDARSATLVTPPTEVWSWPGAQHPIGLDLDRDGQRELIVAFEGKALVGRSPSLVERFRVPGITDWDVAGPIAPLVRDGGVLYSYAQINSSSGEGRVVAVSPAGLAWASTPIITAGSGQGYTTTDDFDGDGQDDVIGSLRGLLRFFDGADGRELGSAAPTHSLLPLNVRGRAGNVTTVAAASYHDLQGLSLSRPLASSTPATWSATLPDRFYASFGAALECPGGLVVVNAGYQSPHLVFFDAATGQERAHVLLSRGRRFDDDAALADAGVLAGALGNVTAFRALWPGQPAVVVGGTDGYLYALDGCAVGAPLLWAMNLRAPVGEPIAGDLDGDGQQELVVTAADGFLYGIGPERFPAPAWVHDIEPGRADGGDIDVSNARAGLSAAWAAVPGATGYEYALLTAGGTPLTRHPTVPGNPFVPVPADVTTVEYGLMLREGARYLFAVRALGASGASAEVLSDGVRYAPVDLPDAGTLPVPDAGAPDAGAAVDGGTSPSKIQSQSGCRCDAGASLVWLGLAALLRRRAQPRTLQP